MSLKAMFSCVLATELSDALKHDGVDTNIVKGENVQKWLKSVLEFVVAKHELNKNVV